MIVTSSSCILNRFNHFQRRKFETEISAKRAVKFSLQPSNKWENLTESIKVFMK